MAQKSSDLVFENRYICQSEVKQGAFGIVYLGFDLTEKRPVAIKLEKEKKSHTCSSLTNEARILTKLKGVKGVPTLFWSGKKPGLDERALAMTYLGKDLQYHFTRLKCFSLKTTLMCGVQLIRVLQLIHDKGVVHRDIKPDNILTCFDDDDTTLKRKTLLSEKDLNQIYLCDFGISKIYKENNKHIDYKINKPFIGTIRFASEAAHKGFEVSRKDDLESLGYVLMYLYKGKLPWQNIDKALGNLRKDRVGVCKQIEHLMEYFHDLFEEFLEFFKYVKGLTFKENPNYDYLIGLFQGLAKKKGLKIDDLQWDWKKKNKGNGNSFYNANINNNPIPANPKKEESKEKIELKKETKVSKGRNESIIITKPTVCIKKKTLSDSEELSFKEKKKNDLPMQLKPKINIKKNYNSDDEGKRNKIVKSKKNMGFLVAEPENHHHNFFDESHDNEVFFNSKSLISSNFETHESSILIKNKDFTTLKFNVFDQEENGFCF